MTPEEHKIKEYQYLAAVLIFGGKSSYLKELDVYKIISTNKLLHLTVNEISHLESTSGNIIRHRNLSLIDGTMLKSSRVVATDVAEVISCTKNDKTCSDVMFSDYDFKVLEGWKNLCKNRVEKLGLLIKILDEKYKEDIPLLISEFPNICGMLIKDIVDTTWR